MSNKFFSDGQMDAASYALVKGALNEIYKKTRANRENISSSRVCYCIHCLGKFPPYAVKNWVSIKGMDAAECPLCSTASVLGDRSGVEITEPLLAELQSFWYERQVLPDEFDYSWFTPVE